MVELVPLFVCLQSKFSVFYKYFNFCIYNEWYMDFLWWNLGCKIFITHLMQFSCWSVLFFFLHALICVHKKGFVLAMIELFTPCHTPVVIDFFYRNTMVMAKWNYKMSTSPFHSQHHAEVQYLRLKSQVHGMHILSAALLYTGWGLEELCPGLSPLGLGFDS